MRSESALQAHVRDGMGAVEAAHRDYFEQDIRPSFGDSLELDAAMLEGHEQENRWDYLLGHIDSDLVVAVEPHATRQDQISTVINKRAAALQHLRPHLREGQKVSRWLWVASGSVQFADTEKAKLRLAQHGIEFVGRKVAARHLPGRRR